MGVLERLSILADDGEELWALVIWVALGLAVYELGSLAGGLSHRYDRNNTCSLFV